MFGETARHRTGTKTLDVVGGMTASKSTERMPTDGAGSGGSGGADCMVQAHATFSTVTVMAGVSFSADVGKAFAQQQHDDASAAGVAGMAQCLVAALSEAAEAAAVRVPPHRESAIPRSNIHAVTRCRI